MILAVTIGNTNLRCAVGSLDDNCLAMMPVKALHRAEDFITFLNEQFQPDIWAALQGSVLSSVVPDKTPLVTEALRLKTGKPPQRMGLSSGFMDFSAYQSPLGEDRAVCCFAALAKYPPPLVVVDLGTATTINCLNAKGVFLGGAILAGITTGLHALAARTALLPSVMDFSEVPLIGNNTRENLLSGAVVGGAGAVEGYINRVGTQLGGIPKIILTGGNAPLILPHCRFDFVHEPHLLTDGLFRLYEAGEDGLYAGVR